MCIRDRNYTTTKHEQLTAIQLNKKLIQNNIYLTKVDKGNTIALLDLDEYKQKVYKFISNNNITKLNNDPTKKYTLDLNKTINKCTDLFEKHICYSLKPIKASAPCLKGLPKVHKKAHQLDI